MRDKKEIENKLKEFGSMEVKNRDNYWYNLGFSQALLYCLGENIENFSFNYSDEKIMEEFDVVAFIDDDIDNC